jgi:hypothetical protein
LLKLHFRFSETPCISVFRKCDIISSVKLIGRVQISKKPVPVRPVDLTSPKAGAGFLR